MIADSAYLHAIEPHLFTALQRDANEKKNKSKGESPDVPLKSLQSNLGKWRAWR